MHATGAADPFMQGCIGLLVTIRVLRKILVPKEFYPTFAVIDNSNYREYDAPIETRACLKMVPVV